MRKFTWIFDAGHGGLRADGSYTTDPKIGKQYTFGNGVTIYEGAVNRRVLDLVVDRLTFLGVDVAIVSDPVEDVSLGERCRRVNAIVAKSLFPCIFVSLHSNAGKGKGFEVFTSIGQDASDTIASVFCEEIQRSFPEYPLRQDKDDGDADKEANFYVIRPDHNQATARVLLENLFFDNEAEATVLLSTAGQQRLADYVCRAVVWIENKIIL